MTPPNVLGAPKPTSSVMMSRMLGAPLGGTTRAGQYIFDCKALSSISPLNCCGGGGIYLPSIVVVAQGEPGGHAGGCWAATTRGAKTAINRTSGFPSLADRLFIAPLSRARIRFDRTCGHSNEVSCRVVCGHRL